MLRLGFVKIMAVLRWSNYGTELKWLDWIRLGQGYVRFSSRFDIELV